jgi:hypothetical protein
VSPESLEQLFLFALLGMVLLQLVIRWARNARARSLADDPRGLHAPTEPEPAWPPPATHAAPQAARPRPMSAPKRTQVAPRPAARFHAAPAARALRRGNRAALRGAFVLATVLGPPRALDEDR